MTSASRSAAVIVLAALCVSVSTGCASVEYRDDDTVPETVGKTLVIAPAFVGVLLFEGFAADVRYRQERIEFNERLGHGETDHYRELR